MEKRASSELRAGAQLVAGFAMAGANMGEEVSLNWAPASGLTLPNLVLAGVVGK